MVEIVGENVLQIVQFEFSVAIEAQMLQVRQERDPEVAMMAQDNDEESEEEETSSNEDNDSWISMGSCPECGNRGLTRTPCTHCEDSGMIYEESMTGAQYLQWLRNRHVNKAKENEEEKNVED